MALYTTSVTHLDDYHHIQEVDFIDKEATIKAAIDEAKPLFVEAESRHSRLFSETGGVSYKGNVIPAALIGPRIQDLMDTVNTRFRTKYNSVIVAWYPTGEHYIDAHCDVGGIDLKEGIVTLSYGAPRTFRVQSKSLFGFPFDFETNHCMALRMAGTTFQHIYVHELLKSDTQEERYSFSFRTHVEE